MNDANTKQNRYWPEKYKITNPDFANFSSKDFTSASSIDDKAPIICKEKQKNKRHMKINHSKKHINP